MHGEHVVDVSLDDRSLAGTKIAFQKHLIQQVPHCLPITRILKRYSREGGGLVGVDIFAVLKNSTLQKTPNLKYLS